jgi:hypothetical protein
MSRFSAGNPNTVLTDLEATFYDAVLAANSNSANIPIASDSPATARSKSIARHQAIIAAAKASGLPHLGGGSRLALLELNA